MEANEHLSAGATVAELLAWAFQQLSAGESPKTDARLLLAHCLDQSSTYLMTWPDKIVETSIQTQFQQLVMQRKMGHPVAHLIGTRYFWTLSLEVTPDTLIPRPETELLVEQALQLPIGPNAKVLDLGTGTGAIALSLAYEKPTWQVIGVDIVDDAVALAKRNAIANQLPDVKFLQSSWFTHLSAKTFDLIVSNPPYVESDSQYLSQGDVRFEPITALTAGKDGLDDIKIIIEQSLAHLKKGGWLMIEHGYNQATELATLFTQYKYTNIFHKKDLNNQPRITAAQKP
ncbi:peptide chain release factor N(5)-glutamine methyltransferase [Aliiglaciecola sp. 3_MG-2023]|uniref:peptide chain release factor N(5)-glutamine methyltransferase n=1 Tax=Aliiglaciecola sp. 3_MG-2023 TaxID=3062644 RepID=UPI0026E20ED1|nr:peptide chain release factor N(5)-glutamine methyltransferase [Aliiglaciecola sp. 3_MG-2023]MDO6695563.1 peptide chain release factor N(5)-glutamine methyltransferase [Aliiglaciecola sp. 3_MG-2023]